MKHAVITTTKCNIEGAARWSAGDWKSQENRRRGPWVAWTAIKMKEGNTWKMVNLTYSVTPPPTNK